MIKSVRAVVCSLWHVAIGVTVVGALAADIPGVREHRLGGPILEGTSRVATGFLDIAWNHPILLAVAIAAVAGLRHLWFGPGDRALRAEYAAARAAGRRAGGRKPRPPKAGVKKGHATKGRKQRGRRS